VTLALFLLLAASATFDESFRAGLLALQRNDLKAAETHLGDAAKLEPNNARVWLALARVWWKLDRTADANQAADKAARFGPSDPVVLSGLAVLYADAGQTLRAADAQARYFELTPADDAARAKAESLYFAVAEPLLQQKKFGEAIDVLTQAPARALKSAQLELALGVAYYGLRRFDEAAGAFLNTIAIDADLERPYVFLGRFLGQIPDRLPEAIAVFARYQQSHPDRAAGYLLHAKALNARTLDTDTARALLEKAIALDPRDASAHFEMGVALERLQRYEEAVPEFQRAADLDPQDSAAHYRLSRLYDRLGKPEDAQRERLLHARLVEAEEAARQ